jgi:hypothetical protein
MKALKYLFITLGVGAMVSLPFLIIWGAVHHFNSNHGDESVFGLSIGWIVFTALLLLIIVVVGRIAWRFWKRRSGKTTPDAPVVSIPQSTPPPAPKEKKSSWLGSLVGTCIVLFLLFGACSQILDMARSQWKPQRPCANVEQLNEEGVYNFSKKTSDTPAFVDPGSDTELCFGAWVTIPDNLNGHNWDVLFADPNATADGCIAWIEYPDVEKIYGSYQGDREIGERDKPLRLRFATNCRIGIYPRA